MHLVLYLSEQVGGTNGCSAASRDILISLLLSGNKIGILCRERQNLPKKIEGIDLPNLEFDHRIQDWPPSKKEKELICSKLNNFDIRIVISNDLAFHNLFHFAILPNIRNSFKTVVISHTQPHTFHRAISHQQLISRFSAYDHFITVSKKVLEEWRSNGLPHKFKKTHYIPNCCNEETSRILLSTEKSSIRKQLKLPENVFISVCIASLQKRKNQKLIIQNVGKLTTGFPDSIFCFIGPILANGGNEIQKLAKNSPHSKSLKIIGEVINAQEFIRAADLMILPSKGEVMPLCILEAMTLKTPVLASDVGGISEMIQNEENGLLFDINNTDSFIKKFHSLRNSNSLRNNLSQNAYNFYTRNFSRKNHILKWKKIIHDMI